MPSVDPAKPSQMMRASHFAFPGAVLNAQCSCGLSQSCRVQLAFHLCSPVAERLTVFASGVYTGSWPKGRVWNYEWMRHRGCAKTLLSLWKKASVRKVPIGIELCHLGERVMQVDQNCSCGPLQCMQSQTFFPPQQ